MRLLFRVTALFVFAGFIFALPGCSGPRYEIWRSHDSQYASWDHAKFSIKKVFERSKPTPDEKEKSLKQDWWGELFSGGN